MDRFGVLSLLLVVFVAGLGIAQAGCGDRYGHPPMCCRGKNNTCYSTSPNQPRCFCDSNCLHMGDCCSDYNRTCTSEDCVVSGWKAWESCNKACGFGQMLRRRYQVRPARNGGKACPILTQKRACIGYSCKRKTPVTYKPVARAPVNSDPNLVGRRISSEPQKKTRYQADTAYGQSFPALHETARIIPAQFGTWRTSKVYDITRDIRKNLYHYYKHKNVITGKRPYCAHFEVVRSRRSCQAGGSWAKGLSKASTVCVECQPTAMKNMHGHGLRCKGHGVVGKETRWNAVNVIGCHGMWIMKHSHRECSCERTGSRDFIFV